MVKFTKLSILSYVLCSEFFVGGYFKRVVCCVVVEALVVLKRKVKEVCLSVFGRCRCEIKVGGGFLGVGSCGFFDLKCVQQVLCCSEVLSGVRIAFGRVRESCSFSPGGSGLSSSAD